jgi:SSS family solute:Na+ symporter
MLPIGFLAALIGVAAKANYPDLTEATAALPKMVASLHPLAAGVTLAALWAADVSTACGLLLSSATIIVRDILPRRLVAIKDQPSLFANRLVVLIIGAVTLILALQIEGILNALMKGLSLMTGPTVVVLLTFFAPRLCRVSSAFWTISVGVLVAVVWLAMPELQERLHIIYAEWVVCLAVFLIVSILDKRPITRSPVSECVAGGKQ